MVRVSSPAKLRPWSELTAKMVMGVVPALVRCSAAPLRHLKNQIHPKSNSVLQATKEYLNQRCT